MSHSRNDDGSGLKQAIPDFFFAARRDEAFRALTLIATYLRGWVSRWDASHRRMVTVN